MSISNCYWALANEITTLQEQHERQLLAAKRKVETQLYDPDNQNPKLNFHLRTVERSLTLVCYWKEKLTPILHRFCQIILGDADDKAAFVTLNQCRGEFNFNLEMTRFSNEQIPKLLGTYRKILHRKDCNPEALTQQAEKTRAAWHTMQRLEKIFLLMGRLERLARSISF